MKLYRESILDWCQICESQIQCCCPSSQQIQNHNNQKKKKSKTAFQKSWSIPIVLNKLWRWSWNSITNCHRKQFWQKILTMYSLVDIHNSSPSLSDDVIMSLGTHESRSASIIPRGSSWATWWPRIYRRQGVDPQTWEPYAKPPTRKRYRRGRKKRRESAPRAQEDWHDVGCVEDEMKCRVQRGMGYKSWKTGKSVKWEKEGQIKGRRKRQSHKTGSLILVCWAVEDRKHFSPTCWNPVATGVSSKFTQLMPSGSRFALWCPITWKQGNSSHKTWGVHQADPMTVKLSPSFQCHKYKMRKFGILNQMGVSARGRPISQFYRLIGTNSCFMELSLSGK